MICKVNHIKGIRMDSKVYQLEIDISDLQGSANENLSIKGPQAMVNYLDTLKEAKRWSRSLTGLVMLEERALLQRAGFDLGDDVMLALLAGVAGLKQVDIDKVKNIVRDARAKTTGGTLRKKSVRK